MLLIRKKSQFLNEVATGEAGHENKIELIKWCHSQKHCEKFRVDEKEFWKSRQFKMFSLDTDNLIQYISSGMVKI